MTGTGVLIDHVEALRLGGANLASSRRGELGQFLTPNGVATFMASMLRMDRDVVRLLDPGAGVGGLSAAAVSQFAICARPPRRLTITAYELDPGLTAQLAVTLKLCAEVCDEQGISFESQLVDGDFIQAAVGDLERQCVDPDGELFTSAILNPPYRKLASASATRRLLGLIGVDASNLYTAFLAATLHVLRPGADFVAITPRSFCNGPYFRDFRRYLLASAEIRRLHLFESRSDAFKSDEVLQENLIMAGERTPVPRRHVILSSSIRPGEAVTERQVPPERVVHPGDSESFIRFLESDADDDLAGRMSHLPSSLPELGLTASTGRIVDFRNRSFLRSQPVPGASPLIYPAHFSEGFVSWPKADTRKPNAILVADPEGRLLVPDGNYVLVRRFSAKEERRRVVAAVFESGRTGCPHVGFENHLNYFHRSGKSLDRNIARGLALYLNSTFVDSYFRQFSGHTQVNATDLRSIRYPTLDQLRTAGQLVRRPRFPDQMTIDELVAAMLPVGSAG